MLGGLLSTFSEGIGIGMLIPFLDFIFETKSGADAGGWFTRTLFGFADSIEPDRRAIVLGGLIAGLILLRILLGFATSVLGLWITGRVSHDLRAAVSRQILNVAFGYIAHAGKGRLLNTIANETWRVTEAVQLCWKLVSSSIAVVVLTAIMLVISWQLTVLVLTGTLLVSLLLRRIARHTSEIGRLALEDNRILADRMISLLDGVRVIRFFGQEPRESPAVRRQFGSRPPPFPAAGCREPGHASAARDSLPAFVLRRALRGHPAGSRFLDALGVSLYFLPHGAAGHGSSARSWSA